MSYWPFWLSGCALAAVVMAHWFLLGGALGVSGKFSALVNRMRYGASPPQPVVSEEELLRALTQATLDEFPEAAGVISFGSDASSSLGIEPTALESSRAPAAPLSLGTQLLFLVGISGGGLLAGFVVGGPSWDLGLASAAWSRVSQGSSWVSFLLLFLGGALVGAGTRMSGGCTSGHGLCGVSRIDKSSLLATASFFGAGILGSFLLGGLL